MSSNSPISHTPNLTLSAAQAALSACMAHSQSIGIPMNISIYDSTLHLLAFARMPGAKLTSIDIAHNKALTAAGHRLPTDAYTVDKVGPGGPMYGVNNSNGGRFTTIGGGVPVVVEGVCVGSVGCSTGTPGQDKVSRLGGASSKDPSKVCQNMKSDANALTGGCYERCGGDNERD